MHIYAQIKYRYLYWYCDQCSKLQGQALVFTVTHVVAIGSSIVLYALTVGALVVMKKPKVQPEGQGGSKQKPPDMAAERRLVISCATSTFIFILGQVSI